MASGVFLLEGVNEDEEMNGHEGSCAHSAMELQEPDDVDFDLEGDLVLQPDLITSETSGASWRPVTCLAAAFATKLLFSTNFGVLVKQHL